MDKPLKITLPLSDKERQSLEGFLEDHGNCIDSGLAFEVSDSGIVLLTVVICQCGGKQDITDYGFAWRRSRPK